MTKICIVTSYQTERELLQPLIDRLEAHPVLDLDLFSMDPDKTHVANYQQTQAHFRGNRPDIVIIPCDRAEALDAALGAFEWGIPIIHFHAGDLMTASKDVMYRHMISLMASIHLCNGPSAKKVVTDLLTATKRSTTLVYDVGSTASDSNADLDESLVPNTPYDLILYHPPTNDPELINRELDEIEELLDPGLPVCWLYPNGDPGSETIVKRINSFECMPWTLKDLPRPQFLGLVKNCRYFIGNSSSMVYEAPMWIAPENILHIGDRNRDRSFDGIQPGATDQIVSILEVIACGPQV